MSLEGMIRDVRHQMDAISASCDATECMTVRGTALFDPAVFCLHHLDQQSLLLNDAQIWQRAGQSEHILARSFKY